MEEKGWSLKRFVKTNGFYIVFIPGFVLMHWLWSEIKAPGQEHVEKITPPVQLYRYLKGTIQGALQDPAGDKKEVKDNN